ncbi:MFS transporter [Myxococcota bacterium]|nr:MFS transporter [Myxococcota bacterium]
MFRSPLFPIGLTVFVDVLGLTIVIPLLPRYGEQLGASTIVATSLFSVYSLCQLLSGPALGRLSDRIGRKPVLLASQLGTLVGFLVLAFADSLWMLFLGRILDGLTAGNLSIAQAYISDVTKPENRTKAFAIIGIAFGTGFMFGPAISGILADRYGLSAPFFLSAALSALSVIATATLLPKVDVKPHEAEAKGRLDYLKELFAREAPRNRLLEFFFFALSFATLNGGLTLFLERRFGYSIAEAGYVFAFSGFVGAVVQGGIGRLVKRLGDERLSLVGFVSMALGFFLLAPTTVLPALLVVIVIASFGSAVTRPTLTTLLTKSVGPTEQGAALGVSQSVNGMGQILGPLVAGWLIGHELLAGYGLAAGLFAAIGAVLCLRRERPAPSAPVG